MYTHEHESVFCAEQRNEFNNIRSINISIEILGPGPTVK